MNSNISRNLSSQCNSLKTKVIDRFDIEHLYKKKTQPRVDVKLQKLDLKVEHPKKFKS